MVKKAQKAAPAPAPAEETTEDVTMEVGQTVRFLGYDAEVPEEERVLTEGAEYEVVGFTEAEGEDPGGDPILRIENPEFNPKKKEHPENNPKYVEVQAFANELEILEDASEGEAEATEEAAAPASAQAKKTAAKAAAPAAPAKGKAAAAAPAGKKAAAPAKKTAAAPVKKEEAAPVDPDAVPELENEDADVLALVEGSEDLIATAQELEAQTATTEYQLGGILYHIKKDKAHRALVGEDGKPIAEYQERGGFEKFLQDYFNIEYRKAMWLIDIYIHFSQAGITDAAAKVAQMGWTKAKTIARELTKEEANTDDLIELAMNNTVADLSEAIKGQEHVGGTKGELKKFISLKFRYAEEEAATINGILEAAVEALSLKNIGEALSHIVTEWAAEHGGKIPAAKAGPAQRPAVKRAAAAAPAPAAAPAKKVAAKRVAAAAA